MSDVTLKRFWLRGYEWYGHGGDSFAEYCETIEEILEYLKNYKQIGFAYADHAEIIYIQDDMTPKVIATYTWDGNPRYWKQIYEEDLSPYFKKVEAV